MDNVFDNMMEIFKNNKKYLIYAILAYALVVITIITFIWWPKEKDYLTYEDVNISEKQQEVSKSYLNELLTLFVSGNKETMQGMISKDYIEYTNKTKENIVNDLERNGFFGFNSKLSGVSLYTDKNTYVYTTTLYCNGNQRQINIIEKEPYRYELAFDDFYGYKKINSEITRQNIKFKILDIYRNLKYIEINMKIENINKTYVRFDFNSLNCVQVVLEDGKRYSVSNLISTSDYTDVEPDTSINKNFVFEIPAQSQNKIRYIIFNGVILEFSKPNIEIDLKLEE